MFCWLAGCGDETQPLAARGGLQGDGAATTACDQTGCSKQGETCAIYCNGNQTRFDCHVPGPSDVPVGGNCLGRTCSNGVCVTNQSGLAGAISECLQFCKHQSECALGQYCDMVTVHFNCEATKSTPLQASVCRRR